MVSAVVRAEIDATSKLYPLLVVGLFLMGFDFGLQVLYFSIPKMKASAYEVRMCEEPDRIIFAI